jgi:hypothetical protein
MEKQAEEKQLLQCKVPFIRLRIGHGDYIILVQGDAIRVSKEPNAKNHYRIYDGKNCVIGHLTKRDLMNIEGIRLKKKVNHAVAPEE